MQIITRTDRGMSLQTLRTTNPSELGTWGKERKKIQKGKIGKQNQFLIVGRFRAEADLFGCRLRQRLRSTIDEAARRASGRRSESGRFPSGAARSSSFGESAVTATSSNQKVILTSRGRGFQF